MNDAFGAVGATFTALVLVALTHPDPILRATAERLLRALFGIR